jgi:blue copper oxidase
MRLNKIFFATAAWAAVVISGNAQNALYIPPPLSGTTFNLNVQSGNTQFFPGINTPTYGINGVLLAPTLMLNKGDFVTLNVTNDLNTTTTLHWHGLHVPAMDDGGPHQVIFPGTTWSPDFTVMNNAGTYWYHPHGEGKTDLQVSKGIAGIIIVKDDVESTLALPRDYGVDDFPLIVQTKAFDVLHQIAIATEMDTARFVNGTYDPYLDAPAQVVRFRLLNGSSLRTYYFGFSNNQGFFQIATDGGLMELPVMMTRMRLSPGERVEVLVDLSALQGQSIDLMSDASELPSGIYGAAQGGVGVQEIPGYDLNPLNGTDFSLLHINVVAPTANPVTAIPFGLTSITPMNASQATYTRTLSLDPASDTIPDGLVEGPFTINGHHFSMDTVNDTTYLNRTEIWKLVNHTEIAHPIHIHDVQFQLLDVSGGAVPSFQQGWKDVVLVPAKDSVSFITKFEDFADTVPYMYHCHMLHHEDDGMMGSFVVLDSATLGTMSVSVSPFKLNAFPNPTDGKLCMEVSHVPSGLEWFNVIDAQGRTMLTERVRPGSFQCLDVSGLPDGIYTLEPVACYQRFNGFKFVVRKAKP